MDDILIKVSASLLPKDVASIENRDYQQDPPKNPGKDCEELGGWVESVSERGWSVTNNAGLFDFEDRMPEIGAKDPLARLNEVVD